MIVTFLRHGSLLPPFNDYNRLSLEVLSALALQETDPSIDPTKASNHAVNTQILAQKYDQLLVSPSKRTQDTALVLSKYLELPSYTVTDELREILFNPAMLLTEQEYKDGGLQTVRQKLFEALVDNSNIETGRDVVERVKKLQNFFSEKDGSILIITHGFLLRFLDIYYRQKSSNFSIEKLTEATNYDYLTGFTVTIN